MLAQNSVVKVGFVQGGFFLSYALFGVEGFLRLFFKVRHHVFADVL